MGKDCLKVMSLILKKEILVHNNEIKLEEYNIEWPNFFKKEAEKIKETLFSVPLLFKSRSYFEVHHIGSTALPGMSAKPVIDILLECDDIYQIDLIKKQLSTLGYNEFSRHVIPHYSFFSRKIADPTSFHLHLRERGDPQIKRHINFRDYLTYHPEDAKEYEKIKKTLAAEFFNNRYEYTLGKDEFIRSIDIKAKKWEKRRRNFLQPNTNLDIKNISKEKIGSAIEANIIVHMTHFEQYISSIDFKRQPKYTRILNNNILDDSFNYILESEVTEQNADAAIQEAIKPFEEKNIPYCWWNFPNDKPKNIDLYLERNGFTHTHTNIGMYFDLGAWDGVLPTLENFEIKKVRSEKEFSDFSYVLSNDSNFLDNYFKEISTIFTGEDPQEYFVGYLNSKPIVCGLICFFGKVAGLHCLTTSPYFRRKGYGAAMQMARLKRAKELGYQTAILQASSSAYSLYLKLGWQPHSEFKEFKKVNK